MYSIFIFDQAIVADPEEMWANVGMLRNVMRFTPIWFVVGFWDPTYTPNPKAIYITLFVS